MVIAIVLSKIEEASRARNIMAQNSPSPIPYSPITPVLDPIYTYVGHAAQYGVGRRNGRTVRILILHTTESSGENFIGGMHYEAWRGEQVSCTALAGRDGELGYDVAEDNRPFTTGRWNDESETLEIDGKAGWNDAQWRSRPRQLQAIEDWLVSRCRYRDIPGEWLSGAEVAQGASREGTTPRQGVNRGISDHRTCNDAAISLGGSPTKYSHVDIGLALRTIVMNEIIPRVRARLEGVILPNPGPTADPYEVKMETLTMWPNLPRYDSRGLPGQSWTANKMNAGVTRAIDCPDANATAAFVHITAVNTEGDGFFTFFAGPTEQSPVPDGATCNYKANTVSDVGALVPVVNGQYFVYSLARTHIVIELQGSLK